MAEKVIIDYEVRLSKLRAELKSLNRDVKKTESNFTKSGKKGEEAFRKVKQGAKGAKKEVDRLGGSLNQVKSLLLATISVTALIAVARQVITINAEISDSIANVQKTTQLTSDEVNTLVESLKKINTRTSLKGLLGIATAAGRLAVAKEDVLDFTTSVDKVFVALGDSLPGTAEEIATSLAKITNLFGLEEEFGIAEGIERLGSAMNFLGATTKAQEANILGFTNEMIGVAGITNVAIGEILGLGAALDVIGQKVQVSGTVVSQVFIKMGSKVTEFAKIAGISTKEFSDLLKKDVFEAFILVLEGINQTTDSMESMAAVFDSIQLDGKRTVSVLGALAKNVREVRRDVEKANEELARNTSITEEFDIKNNNLAATLEKLGKTIQNTFIDSGLRDFLKSVVIAIDEEIKAFSRFEDRITDTNTVLAKAEQFFNEQVSVLDKLSFSVGITSDHIQLFIDEYIRLQAEQEDVTKQNELYIKGLKDLAQATIDAGKEIESNIVNIKLLEERVKDARIEWKLAESGTADLANKLQILRAAELALSNATGKLTDEQKEQAKALKELEKEKAKQIKLNNKLVAQELETIQLKREFLDQLRQEQEARGGIRTELKTTNAVEQGLLNRAEEERQARIKEGVDNRAEIEADAIRKSLSIRLFSAKQQTELLEEGTLEFENAKAKELSITEEIEEFKRAEIDKTRARQREQLQDSLDFTIQVSGQLIALNNAIAASQIQELENTNRIENDAVQAALERDIRNTEIKFRAGLTSEQEFIDKTTALEDQRANAEIARQRKLEKETNEIRTRAAQTAKALAIFEAIINVAKAITAQGVTTPQAIAAGVLGAIQVATIIAQPIPEFAEGVIGYKGTGTETSDSNLVRISRNESIIKASRTKQYRPELEAINEGRFDEFVNKNYIYPAMMKGSEFDDYNIVRQLKKNSTVNIGNTKDFARHMRFNDTIQKRYS